MKIREIKNTKIMIIMKICIIIIQLFAGWAPRKDAYMIYIFTQKAWLFKSTPSFTYMKNMRIEYLLKMNSY
jgi:hypothetical protein